MFFTADTIKPQYIKRA